MGRVIRIYLTAFVAAGLVLASAASYGACGLACCCHDGVAAATSAADTAIGPAGCCCEAAVGYPGHDGTAAAVWSDGPRLADAAACLPAAGRHALTAEVRPYLHGTGGHACNSPPIYKLVSSYLI